MNLMLEHSIDAYRGVMKITREVVFFDRGIPELIGYCEATGIEIPQSLLMLFKNIRIILRYLLCRHGVKFIKMILKENRTFRKRSRLLIVFQNLMNNVVIVLLKFQSLLLSNEQSLFCRIYLEYKTRNYA